MAMWFTIPWLFPCCKLMHFIAYLFGFIFVYFCNIVKPKFKAPSRSFWLFLGMIVGLFTYGSNLLRVFDLIVYNMWPWSINFYLSSLILILFLETHFCVPEFVEYFIKAPMPNRHKIVWKKIRIYKC